MCSQSPHACFIHYTTYTVKFSHFLKQLCVFWGKTMKQQKTTVLIAILSLVSFMLGHGSLHVKDGWDEPIVLWLAVVLKTGTLFLRIISCM
jgi:hypothetical protein